MWDYPDDSHTAYWDGTLKAKRFIGDGSSLSNVVTAVDDGTNITVSFGSTALFRIVKSTGQMQILGGYDTDTTI